MAVSSLEVKNYVRCVRTLINKFLGKNNVKLDFFDFSPLHVSLQKENLLLTWDHS